MRVIDLVLAQATVTVLRMALTFDEKTVVFGVGAAYRPGVKPFWGIRGQGTDAVRPQISGSTAYFPPIGADERLRVETEVAFVFRPGNNLWERFVGVTVGQDPTRDSEGGFTPPADGGWSNGMTKPDPLLISRRWIPGINRETWSATAPRIRTVVTPPDDDWYPAQDLGGLHTEHLWRPELSPFAVIDTMSADGAFDGWNDATIVVASGTPPYVLDDPERGYVEPGWRVASWVGNETLEFGVTNEREALWALPDVREMPMSG